MPWGRTTATHCERIHGYPHAQRHFHSRGPVRSIRWKPDERPLLGTAEKWFKNVEGPNEDYYDLVCGNTTVLRLFRPEPNGEYRVWVRSDNSRMCWNFLYYMGYAWHAEHHTVGGGKVKIPYSYDVDHPYNSIPKDWSACLTYDKGGRVILEKSDHRPYYTRKSSKRDKAERKEVLKSLEHIVDLMTIRMPHFHEHGQYHFRRGQAFGGHLREAGDTTSVFHTIERLRDGNKPDDDTVEALLPFCQEVYNVSLSKRIFNSEEEHKKVGSRYSDAAARGFAPVTDAAFRKALRGALIRHSSLKKQTENVELPKFPADLPRRFFFVKIRSNA